MKTFFRVLFLILLVPCSISPLAAKRSKKRPKDPYAKQMAYLGKETPVLASSLTRLRKERPKKYASLMQSSQTFITLLARYKRHKTSLYADRLQERGERTGRAFLLAMDASNASSEDQADLSEQLRRLLRQTLADKMSQTSTQLIRDLATVERMEARLVFWEEHHEEQIQELVRRELLREPGWLGNEQRLELLSVGKSRSINDAETVVALETRLTELAEQYQRSRQARDRSALMEEALAVAEKIRQWHIQYIERTLETLRERSKTHSSELDLWTEQGDRIIEDCLQKLLSGQFSLDLLDF